MRLPRFSVNRPVFTTMVTLIVVILGAVSLSRIRIDLLPAMELPTLSIRTTYEGASPEVMERLVTSVIEEIVATVPGVEEMISSSSEGNSTVRVTFKWGTDIDTAALEVQATIEDEINELPEDIVRPRVNKFDIESFPVVILGISSGLDPVEMTELIENQVRYRFARIPGVAQVDLWGGYNREIRIALRPDRLKALGLPLNRVIGAIQDANLDLPAGKIEQGRYELVVRAPAEFKSVEEIRETVVLHRDGAAVTIGQIADVQDTYEKLTRITRVNGRRGIPVGIRKQADANTVEVARLVLEEIDRVNAAFPQVNVVPVINQGNFIERSITNVSNSVLYGGGLSILVLLIFLRNFRSTAVIALSIPISVIATFAMIYFGGYTLNLMTLGGMALGVGMMVDGSVVVLENIFRRREEEGEQTDEAAIEGATEVGTAIVASTLTTLVVFLPLIFVRGVSGILFKELALVVMFALTCALLVSLTVVPMLASKLLQHREEREERKKNFTKRFLAVTETALKRLDEGYRRLLHAALRHRAITVIIAVALLGISLLLIPFVGTEFLPPSDEGEVRVEAEMEVGTRLELVDRQMRKVERIVADAVPEIVSSVVRIGSQRGGGNSARGSMQISLKPASVRKRSNTEIANDLRRRLSGAIPGMEIRTRAPQGQFVLQRLLGGEEGLTVEVRGYDLANLDLLAGRVAAAMAEVRGVTDIDVTLESGVPQQDIRVDRAKLADLGLSVRDVTEALETAMAGSRAGDYRTEGHSYRILVKLKDAERRSLDEILSLTLATESGEQVALRNVVSAEMSRGPIVIERKDQQRFVTVTANVEERDIGSAAAEVQAQINRIARPTGYDLTVAGNYEEQQKSFRDLLLSLALALLLVYMVLACQYESLRTPIVVMMSVPFAAIGVLVMLFATGSTLNLQSYIGCIMLGGIVVNNAILLVDQAGRLAAAGRDPVEAAAEAGRRRLRPILMTTLTTILALSPLAFGLGEGADAQAPLARAVVGGLTGSSLITLVLIPVVFTLFYRKPGRDK